MCTRLASSRTFAPRPRSTGGYSLVELLVAVTLLVVALSAFLRSIVGSLELSQTNREFALASQAARRMLERLAAEPFDEVFARHNSTGIDDPGAANSAPGPGFEVPGLVTRSDDSDGLVGRIVFPESTDIPGALSELAHASFPELPKDLDLDGDANDANVSADHALLPVVVVIEWRGRAGNGELRRHTILGVR